MLLDQVLEGEFLNCVMVITPSRAYVNRTITWLFQWCRRPIGLFKECGVANGVKQMKRTLVALAVAAC